MIGDLMAILRTTFRIDYDSDNPTHRQDIESIRKLIKACGFSTTHPKGMEVTRGLNGGKVE